MSKEFNKSMNVTANNEDIKSAVAAEEPIENHRKRFGVVAGCELLNVRSQPCCSQDDNIICAIASGTKVTIGDMATEDFYAITLDDGRSGFCMKKYISAN